MATVPTMATWTAGEKPTAAKLNTNIRDAGNFFRSPPACQIKMSTATSMASGTTFITPTMQAVVFDTDGMANLANSRIDIVTPGVYAVSFYGGFAVNATGNRAYAIFSNASVVLSEYRAAHATLGHLTTVSGFIRCVAGDQITGRAFQTSGGNLDFAVTNSAGVLTAVWQCA